MYCQYCGSKLNDSDKFCTNCGAPVTRQEAAPSQTPVYQSSVYQYQPEMGFHTAQVPDHPIGGLMAWSIITLLLCTIPGIVALVKTCRINKSSTVEEQKSRISSAKTWCIVGTVLGILSMIGTLAAAG